MTEQHAGQAAAEVNAPPQVALYDDAGKQMFVPPGDVEYWLSRGFREDKIDLADAADRLPLVFSATEQAYAELIAHAGDGMIDPGDVAQLATAHAALNELASLIGVIERTIGMLPVAQPEGVTMVRGDATVTVDPGQVTMHEQEGWTRQ